MKFLLVVSKVVMAIVGLAIFAHAEVWGADWKYLGQSDERVFYYYPENISHPLKGAVKVWSRTDYTEKGLMGMVEKLGSRYENFKYSLDLWELKCANKMARNIVTTYHSKSGEVLDSKKYDYPKWKSIAPGSIEDFLHKAVCK